MTTGTQNTFSLSLFIQGGALGWWYPHLWWIFPEVCLPGNSQPCQVDGENHCISDITSYPFIKRVSLCLCLSSYLLLIPRFIDLWTYKCIVFPPSLVSILQTINRQHFTYSISVLMENKNVFVRVSCKGVSPCGCRGWEETSAPPVN